MRLYRLELYKLCSKKIFIAGICAVIALLFIYFWFVEVGEEISVVEGRFYSGYEAVQMNREITEEFAGILTDEKINQIIKKYGLPSKLEENMPQWRDGNFLNDFVTRYFTNGAWENGTLPTEIYSLEESEFGKAYAKMGITPYLIYTKGCKVFVEMLQFGFVLGSVLIICGISVVFAEEDQTKMLPLIFTTEEGKKRDVPAKILASFTLTIFIFLGIILVSLGLCEAVYGLKGFDNLAVMMLSEHMFHPMYEMPFLQYLSLSLGLDFQAFLSLCAITLCISSYQRTSFGAVILSSVCWGFPVLLRIFFGGVMWLIVDSMPVFLMMKGTQYDRYPIWCVILGINVCVSIACLWKGITYYMKKIA